ncbi:MAG TPA: C-GCAxxG-C-C family (seleno)protein [Levilinea sp.]|nr:C-GCAxxG-C-C family (seleno)protein [Levilinea sp.]
MIVPLRTMLRAAKEGRYAVIAPDFPSLAIARLLIDAAEAARAPVLLSHAPSLKPGVDLRHYRAFIQAVRAEADSSTAAVGLHLDHAERIEDIAEALQLGFTSVMIDASQSSWEENVRRTRQVVELARVFDVAVEAEIGHVGSSGTANEAGQPGGASLLTDPAQAAEFAHLTGVDALAVSIGTIHGAYKGQPHLDFERLEVIRDCVEVPLVLHGGSGTGEDNLRRAVRLGICKINVWSDLMTAIQHGSDPAPAGGYRSPNDLFAEQRSALEKTLHWYFQVSDSAGKSAARNEDVIERVKQRFESGYACSESIFMSFAEEEGFSSDTVQLVLSLFGGGICRQGKTCGIVTGGVALLAQRYSHINPAARLIRDHARATGVDFVEWFEREFGSSDCQTLTCCDFTQEDELRRFAAEQIKNRVCMPIIQATARRLIEIREAQKSSNN